MKRSIITIVSIVLMHFPFLAKGQYSLDTSTIARIWVQHLYHCDTTLQRFEQFYRHDESSIRLTFLSVKTTEDSLLLQGRITDNALEGIEASIFFADITASRCDLQQLGASTDRNGRFLIRLARSFSFALYFVSLGFRDASIQIPQLLSILNEKGQ